jgi:hypothetical protein
MKKRWIPALAGMTTLLLLATLAFGAVTYSTAVKNSRLDQVTTAIGSAGKLEIGTTGMASILATIPLANPAAPGASGGVLTLTMPQSDTSADNTGTAAAARIRTSADVDVITGLTVGTSGTDIVLNSTSITAGQQVTMNSFTITHN